MGFHYFNKNKLIMALICVFTAAMVLLPHVTETGAKTAIIIWANSIVPVLLPFFILSDFIKRAGNLEKLPARIYPFSMAVLSGYPMGAKIVSDLILERRLSLSEGKRILSYSLVTGPAFLMGTIGAFVGNSRAAAIITAVHYLGAFLNGIFYRKDAEKSRKKRGRTREKNRKISGTHVRNVTDAEEKKNGYFDHFTLSIMTSFKGMAMILAYLILFMIGMNLLEEVGIFGYIQNEGIRSFLKGLLEMTAGSSMLGACNMPIALKTVLIAFLVSFGGFSVIGQSVSMAEGSGIGFSDIFQIKLTHGLLAGILAAALSAFLLLTMVFLPFQIESI